MSTNQKPIKQYGTELYHYALKHANKNVKYIRKEMVNGKMRYYYADDVAGGKAIKKTSLAGMKVSSVKPNYQERLAKLEDKENKKTSLAGMKVSSVKPNYQERLAKLEDKENKKNKPILDKLKDWAGVDEAEAYSKASSEYKNAKAKKATSQLPGHKEVDDNEVLDAKSKKNVAREKYKKTLLGKIETAIEDIEKLLTGTNDENKVETYKERMARLEAKEKKKQN